MLLQGHLPLGYEYRELHIPIKLLIKEKNNRILTVLAEHFINFQINGIKFITRTIISNDILFDYTVTYRFLTYYWYVFAFFLFFLSNLYLRTRHLWLYSLHKELKVRREQKDKRAKDVVQSTTPLRQDPKRTPTTRPFVIFDILWTWSVIPNSTIGWTITECIDDIMASLFITESFVTKKETISVIME